MPGPLRPLLRTVKVLEVPPDWVSFTEIENVFNGLRAWWLPKMFSYARHLHLSDRHLIFKLRSSVRHLEIMPHLSVRYQCYSILVLPLGRTLLLSLDFFRWTYVTQPFLNSENLTLQWSIWMPSPKGRTDRTLHSSCFLLAASSHKN